jgi:hypothetical protein
MRGELTAMKIFAFFLVFSFLVSTSDHLYSAVGFEPFFDMTARANDLSGSIAHEGTEGNESLEDQRDAEIDCRKFGEVAEKAHRAKEASKTLMPDGRIRIDSDLYEASENAMANLRACMSPQVDSPTRQPRPLEGGANHFVYLGPSVEQEDFGSLVYVGPITHVLVRKISEHRGGKHLIITSFGGKVKDAVTVASMLRRDNWKITVVGVCNSACSGIILLGSDEVHITPGSVIGFHGDGLMKNHLYRLASGDPLSSCFLKDQDQEDLLIEAAGVNRDFWKEQLFRLQPYDVSLGVPSKTTPECRILRYRLSLTYWYPNSEQLRSLFGLNFTGSVAADDLDKNINTIRSFNGAGAKVMVGDEIIQF